MRNMQFKSFFLPEPEIHYLKHTTTFSRIIMLSFFLFALKSNIIRYKLFGCICLLHFNAVNWAQLGKGLEQ